MMGQKLSARYKLMFTFYVIKYELFSANFGYYKL